MPQQVITILSDLGTAGPSVAIIKATLSGYVPGVIITDISHNVPIADLRQAALLLQSAYRNYPAASVHLIIAGLSEGHYHRLMLARNNGHWFIAPDNGILPLVFAGEPYESWVCHEFSSHITFAEWTRHTGSAASVLFSGNPPPFQSGPFLETPLNHQPVLLPDCIECNILTIDRYDNVVLDITKDHFETVLNSRPFSIRMMRLADITSICNNYNDVPRGGALCRFNTSGYLEIAVNHGSAAALLGLRSDGSASLGYRTIKIYTPKINTGS